MSIFSNLSTSVQHAQTEAAVPAAIQPPPALAETMDEEPVLVPANAYLQDFDSGVGVLDRYDGRTPSLDTGTSFGTSGNDAMAGTYLPDRLLGRDGNDELFGLGGNDTLDGGEGNDGLWGGTGDDTLLGSGGIDYLAGESGNDLLDAGSGGDLLSGGAGNDTLIGGAGGDSLRGGNGADVFRLDTASDSANIPGQFDTVGDFEKGIDKIDLTGIDGNAAVAGKQQLQYVAFDPAKPLEVGQVTSHFDAFSGDTMIDANTAGDGGSEVHIVLDGNIPVSASDFLL